MVGRDAKGGLQQGEEVFTRGVDLKRLSEEIAFQLRHLFVAKTLGEAPSELAESEQQPILALAREADPAQLARMLDVVQAAIQELSKSSQPRISFDMALLKAVQLAAADSIPALRA